VRAYALAAIAADWARQGKPDPRATRWPGPEPRPDVGISTVCATRWRSPARRRARAHRLDDAAKAYLDFTQRFPAALFARKRITTDLGAQARREA